MSIGKNAVLFNNPSGNPHGGLLSNFSQDDFFAPRNLKSDCLFACPA